jgi:hypothetical protein
MDFRHQLTQSKRAAYIPTDELIPPDARFAQRNPCAGTAQGTKCNFGGIERFAQTKATKTTV